MSSVQRLVDALNAEEGVEARTIGGVTTMFAASADSSDRWAEVAKAGGSLLFGMHDPEKDRSATVRIPNDDNAPAVILAWLKEGRRL